MLWKPQPPTLFFQLQRTCRKERNYRCVAACRYCCSRKGVLSLHRRFNGGNECFVFHADGVQNIIRLQEAYLLWANKFSLCLAKIGMSS
ncbi:hypothetical protein NPIL_340741 [Nephila pilipes]|uniref:Uncharacterized protein n=1 Tax=Nephila pilipes TaxID=299642 RepID=A0A8X6UK56_NEPPI|nr:hypothetical protein NPIL_128981 [Nephila pilipes]GFU25423.1 hypothetical protein NPIL_340741 [Nephila pilipes]